MTSRTKDTGGEPGKADAEKADSAIEDEVQAKVDVETAQGFRGVEVDPTPNENYSVTGVTSGAPTPETDPEHAEQVSRHVRGVEKMANGVGER